MKYLDFILCAVFLSTTIFGQSERILIDENFSDWNNITPSYSDAQGDQSEGIIDFSRLWITDDIEYLYVRIEVGGKVNLQNDNHIAIYIDTDNNAFTGLAVNGIGAELEYSFGERAGVVRRAGMTFNIVHIDIGLVSSPTVTSTEFEFVIKKSSSFSGYALFPGNEIKIVFKDNDVGQDVLPSASGGVSYSLTNSPAGLLPNYYINKQHADYLRILSYNVLSNGLFDPAKTQKFTRILRAVNPEIIGFQEIYSHSSQETANQVESMIPSGIGEDWYHSKINPDIITVSRFPIIASFAIEVNDSIQNNGAFLIDLRPKHNTDLLLIVAHPPCCAYNVERQQEIDAMMAFVRDAISPGGVLTLEENTPILLIGDMNLVGHEQQRTTLLTGNILDNNSYGADFIPDWDGSNLEDSKPVTTDEPLVFTWYDELISFSPGRLDYIIFTGSVIELKNSYALFTKSMNSDSLDAHNLQANDVVDVSDHLPLVADFDLSMITGINTADNQHPVNFKLEQNYPNPFNPTTTIEYTIPSVGQDGILTYKVTLIIYDVLGREVTTLVDEYQKSGTYKVKFSASGGGVTGLPSGIYFYKLSAGEFVQTKKMVLIN